MTDLYIRPGTDPRPLPFEAHDETGRLWTDLANNDEGRAATGWDDLAPPLPDFDPETQSLVWDATAEGWRVDDLPPPPEPPPPPVPLEIADWQFATVLAEDGIISQAEAEDFCGAGVLPAALDAAIDAIPDETVRNRTRIKVRGAKVYVRTDPATMMLAGILGYAGEAVEDIWRRGAAVA